MTATARDDGGRSINVQAIAFCSFLVILWIAGGASRPDVLGQATVRIAATLALTSAALFGSRPSLVGAWPVAIFLGLALVLPLAQLIPLSPDWWQALPGRAFLTAAARLSGEAQPWRPLAIVPGAAVNAATSLIVPAATLVCILQVVAATRSWLTSLMVALFAASALLGLLQFAGVAVDNPFINDGLGEVSGSFANRNHFALFLAMGCVVVPAWAVSSGRQARWRAPIAIGLVSLFILIILASGSRAGLLVGVLAVAIGFAIARDGIRRMLASYPRWVLRALPVALIGTAAILIGLSISVDRAVGINRVFELDPEQDLRNKALPTVVSMVQEYFPFGSGMGGFDPLFRAHEPFELLGIAYFNHAHNDWLEIILDAGLPGLTLLIAALIWWIYASIKVWRKSVGESLIWARTGSAVLFLAMIASLFDYPVRTPMMMAMAVISAVWLSVGARGPSSALPGDAPHL